MELLEKSAKRLTDNEKKAFQPMPGGQPPMPAGAPAGAPMDPAMAQGGGMPMDPAMAQGGGMPMDPAMAGGAPIDPATGMPMDPAAMGGGVPMDPAAAGMPVDPATGMPIDPAMLEQVAAAEPMVADLTLSEFKQTIREVVSDIMTGGPMEETEDKKSTEIGEINEKLNMLVDALAALTGGAPAPVPEEAAAMAPMAGEPAFMGAGAGVPVAAEGMEQQASVKKGKQTVADLIISKINR
jgi:hypothetical protein